MSSPVPAALAMADDLASALADPRAIYRGSRPADGMPWPQSLAGGAAGIALLHVERARSGRGDWATAHAWLSAAVCGEVTAAANASLFFGVPALAFVLHIAAASSDGYRRVLAALDDATLTVTRARLARAHARIDRAERPGLREFDLIRGLAGLGAYHLSRHPDHPVTRDVLSYLVRLTNPLPGDRDRLPPWWTSVAPDGEPSPDYPSGHGNFGLSHGIGSILAVQSLVLLRGLTVPGMAEAAGRICAWTDQWRQGCGDGPWWPGFITIEQARDQRVDPALRPRPSWCYGVSMARAQQLAGMALREPARQRIAESAMLAVLRDPAQLDRLEHTGLCHGTAGLLHAAGRIAADARTPAISAELPRLTARLIAQLGDSEPISGPGLLDGTAGAALALHSTGTDTAPAPYWDTFLALA